MRRGDGGAVEESGDAAAPGGEEDYIALTDKLTDLDARRALGEALLRTVARLQSRESICVLSPEGEGGWTVEYLPADANP